MNMPKVVLSNEELEFLSRLSRTPIDCSLNDSVNNVDCEIADALQTKGLCEMTRCTPAKGVRYEITEEGKAYWATLS